MYKVTKGRPPVGHTNEQSDGYPPPLPPRPVSPQIASAYPRAPVSFLCCPAVLSCAVLPLSERKRKQKRKSNPSKHRNETETKPERRPKAGRKGKAQAAREGEREGTSAHLPYSFLPSGIPAFVPFPFLYARKEKIFSYQKSPFSLPLGVFISVPTN